MQIPLTTLVFLTHVKALEEWCSRSKLEINVTKTKEVTFSLNQELPTVPLSLDGQTVETVETFKYLGTVLDGQLKFNGNTDYVFKKCSQRLNLLRRLSSLGVSQKILELVYITHVESVLTFHLSVWFGYLSCKCKTKLNKIVSRASKIVGRPQKPLIENLY